MAENKAPALWDGGMEVPKRELRLPNSPPAGVLAAAKDDRNARGAAGCAATAPSAEALAKNSQLSADAPEFYPAGYGSAAVPAQQGHFAPASGSGGGGTANSSSVQERLRRHKDNNGPPTQQHRSHHQMQQQLQESGFVDSPDDIRLKHLISTLTKDPGQFQDLLDIFMDTLTPYFEDVIALSRAAQLLVAQAIDFASFRYTGAKLCCYIEQCCPEFRAALHLTCEGELQKNPNKSGLLLFVAELYSQLHHENIYGSYLTGAFKHLLFIGGNENVKAICQSLKLTGHSLELYDKKALDDIFSRLQVIQPTITGTSLSLINTVMELRRQQWGRHNSPNNASSASEQENNVYWGDIANNTVFYRSDGSKFTKEESQFLAENIHSTEECLADLSDPDELCDPEPEMDEEIQAAFKDFVKLSKR